MKKLFLFALLALPTFTMAQKSSKVYNLLIGTYTTGKSEGIYVYHFDTNTGKVTYQDKVTGINNPSYIAVSNDRKFVYSVNEIGSERTGSASSFSFDARSGKLIFINKQPTGAGPCYISVDKANKNAFVANYAGGSLTVLPIKADGSFSEPIQTIQDEGGSINKSRQAGPHVHTAVLTPDEKYLLYTDLGTDKLNVMVYKPSLNAPLAPAQTLFVKTNAGGGPRHLAFGPNGKYMYLIHEMGGDINAYKYNSGHFEKIQTISILPQEFKGTIGAADIHITPDGNYLYSSNRGSENEIEVFAISKADGKLTFVQRVSCMGKGPRNFVIDPTGKFLLVANQNSDDIYVFKIQKTTGHLTYTGNKIEVGNPSCLKFAAID